MSPRTATAVSWAWRIDQAGIIVSPRLAGLDFPRVPCLTARDSGCRVPSRNPDPIWLDLAGVAFATSTAAHDAFRPGLDLGLFTPCLA